MDRRGEGRFIKGRDILDLDFGEIVIKKEDPDCGNFSFLLSQRL
jgi:hypothetical protein